MENFVQRKSSIDLSCMMFNPQRLKRILEFRNLTYDDISYGGEIVTKTKINNLFGMNDSVQVPFTSTFRLDTNLYTFRKTQTEHQKWQKGRTSAPGEKRE